jgi:hypothetical protein
MRVNWNLNKKSSLLRFVALIAKTASRYIRIEAHKPDGPNQSGGQVQIVELEVYK